MKTPSFSHISPLKSTPYVLRHYWYWLTDMRQQVIHTGGPRHPTVDMIPCRSTLDRRGSTGSWTVLEIWDFLLKTNKQANKRIVERYRSEPITLSAIRSILYLPLVDSSSQGELFLLWMSSSSSQIGSEGISYTCRTYELLITASQSVITLSLIAKARCWHCFSAWGCRHGDVSFICLPVCFCFLILMKSHKHERRI